MKFNPLGLEGAFLIETEQLQDQRGFFARTFCRHEFCEKGLSSVVAQCNISYNSKRGTLRGMHYQYPDSEVKLVRCTRGRIWDVIIDLRPESSTYCQYAAVELTTDNRMMLYIPERFAHGFLTLEDNVEVFYQMSEFYAPGQSCGVRWNDPVFSIYWPEPVQVISERDNNYPDYTP